MNKIRAIILSLFIFMTQLFPAHCDDISVQLALMQFGDLIESETFCVLVYNQEAIKEAIHKISPEIGLDANQMLAGGEALAKIQNSQMSPSAKTAHCELMLSLAIKYGLIQGE